RRARARHDRAGRGDPVDAEVHATAKVHRRHPRIVRAMEEPLRSDGVIALRPWSKADVDEMVACLDGDEEISRWLELVPQPYTAADALAFVGRPDETSFAVVGAEDSAVLGGIGVRWNDAHDVAEIG